MVDGLQLAAELAAAEPDLEPEVATEEVGYRVEGRLFAKARPAALLFRLSGDVASAALRTPGVSAVDEGWIELDVAVPDSFTADRARAWFALAARQARSPTGSRGLD